MNSNRKHFRMACLVSSVVMLAACSNSGEIKSDSEGVAAKPAGKAISSEFAEFVTPTTKPQTQKPQPVVVAKVKQPQEIVPAKKPVVAKTIKPKVVARAPVAKKAQPVKPVVAKPVRVAPKPYVPPKPIVLAVHQKPKVQPKPVARKAAVVRRPAPNPALRRPAPVAQRAPTPKQVITRNIQAAPAPVPRPATVPTRVASRPVYVAPKPVQRQARVQQASFRPAPAPQPSVVRPAVHRPAPPVQYNQSRLTGDFAGNRQAEAFINLMVSRHGFSRHYVTGVISQAKATKWLRKMAYRDANPQLRKKRGGEPSWSRYRSRFLTSKHINTGTAFYNKYRGTLERAASQYGVPSEYILGIMGVETIYGGNVGTDRAIDALATMGFMNSRRGSYFISELEAYLLMTRRTGLDPLKPKASYAGALGLPQFMPSNIKKFGVDYDGDGAVNLWTPHDAIGSIANYLSKHGWRRGEIAAIPAKRTGGRGYSSLKWGFKHKYTLPTLSRKGLAPVYPGVSGSVHMLKLKTNSGYEYWIGGNNFYTITRYNHSSFYAMAVHQLAQEIRKRVKPGDSLPRVIEASADKDLLLRAASSLL